VQKRFVYIRGEYITLGQLLKKEGIIDHGGEAKTFLETNGVYVNEVRETRRGRKLYPGDTIRVGAITLKLSLDVD
jgi:ribosome-associated protein